MEKKKTKETKKAIRLIGKGKKRKRTIFQSQVFQRPGSSMGHCKLKLIQINQIKSNQMQVFEENGKPENPGKQKKYQRRAENQQNQSQITDNLSYKETL